MNQLIKIQLKSPKLLSQGIRKHDYKTLGTIVINSPMSPPSPKCPPTPKINKAEKSLPRTTRSTLSQLRSGFSKFLNSYKARIDPSHSDKCDKCNTAIHTTEHLFACPPDPAYCPGYMEKTQTGSQLPWPAYRWQRMRCEGYTNKQIWFSIYQSENS